MTLDAPLVAAATLRRSRGIDPRLCTAADVTHQLQLAHVLLDGGFDGVATLGEALAGGDHGLGTVDRLDGELVIVDGEPWRVDWHGVAEIMPPETRTPFVVVSTLDSPRTVRLRDVARDGGHRGRRGPRRRPRRRGVRPPRGGLHLGPGAQRPAAGPSLPSLLRGLR